jgi:hypothetical protein
LECSVRKVNDPDYHVRSTKAGLCVRFLELPESVVDWGCVDRLCFDVPREMLLRVRLFGRGVVLGELHRQVSKSMGFVLDSHSSIRVECHFSSDRVGIAAATPHSRCF